MRFFKLAPIILPVLLVATRANAADIPGPRTVCNADGLNCSECWKPYGRDSDEKYEDCASAAKAKGLVEACRHKTGGGDTVFYCLSGVKVPTRTVGGGCLCSANGSAPASGGVAAMALAASALMARRRAKRA